MKDLTIIQNRYDTSNIQTISFDDLVEQVKNPSIVTDKTTKEELEIVKNNSPYFYACEFLENRVVIDDVVHYNYIIADFDDCDSNLIINGCEMYNINYLMFSSINHKIKGTGDRFRVVFPLDGVITKEEWAILSTKMNGRPFFHCNNILGMTDASSFTSNRGFVVPVKTIHYFQKTKLNGNNLSFTSFNNEYVSALKYIRKKQNYLAVKEMEDKPEITEYSKKIVRERLIKRVSLYSINWTKEGVNSDILGLGRGLNNELYPSLVGTLKISGHSEFEAYQFISNFPASQKKIKEWEHCVRRLYKKG